MGEKSKEVVIVSAIRTPIGTYKGSLKNFSADKLGTEVIKNLINQSNLTFDEIDEVILGQVLTAGQGQNPARQASVNAGIPISKASSTDTALVPSLTIKPLVVPVDAVFSTVNILAAFVL